MMKLYFVERKNIDEKKWNNCIQNALNSLIYAYSWYLDIFADNWSAIIAEDYQCVMPIVWRKKMGLRYTYRPFLIQQQGVFFQQNVNCDFFKFYKILRRKRFYGDYNFNYANFLKIKTLRENNNYVLQLKNSYENLLSYYSKNHKRNLKKSLSFDLQISDTLTINELIEFKKLNLTNKLTDSQFFAVKKLSEKLDEKSKDLLGVYDRQGQLLSAGFFVRQQDRIYFLLGATNQQGIEKKASFVLFDYFIRQNAGKNLVLDFEGSNIPGVARFFAGWGSEQTKYYTANLLFLK